MRPLGGRTRTEGSSRLGPEGRGRRPRPGWSPGASWRRGLGTYRSRAVSPPPLPYLSPGTVGPPPTHSRGGTPSPKSQPLSLPDPPPVLVAPALSPRSPPTRTPSCSHVPWPRVLWLAQPQVPSCSGDTRAPRIMEGTGHQPPGSVPGDPQVSGEQGQSPGQAGRSTPAIPSRALHPSTLSTPGGQKPDSRGLTAPTLTRGALPGDPSPHSHLHGEPPPRVQSCCAPFPCLRCRPKPCGAGGSERPPLAD